MILLLDKVDVLYKFRRQKCVIVIITYLGFANLLILIAKPCSQGQFKNAANHLILTYQGDYVCIQTCENNYYLVNCCYSQGQS